MRLFSILLCVPLLGVPSMAQELAPPEVNDADYQFAEGARFEVFAHWHSERSGDALAASCAALADRVSELLMERTGAAPPSADGMAQRLLINLYRRPKDLGMLRLSLGMEAGGGASFFEPGNPEVHVAVQPMMSDLALSELGLPPWVQREVAEQAAFAWLHWVADNSLDGPQAWAWRGLALDAVHQALVEKGRAHKDPTVDPTLGAELAALERELAEGVSPAELLAQGVDHPAGRAACRILALGLPAAPEGLSPGEALAQASLDQIVEPAERLISAAEAPRLFDLETPLIGSWGDHWLQSGLGEVPSRCWFQVPAGMSEYIVSGTGTLYAPGARNVKKANGACQMNLLLGRIDEEYISVAFNSFTGLTVFSYQSLTGEFKILVQQKAGVDIGSNRAFDFRVHVNEDIGVVEIDGTQVATFTIGGRNMTGAYGLGAQNLRGLSLWSDVRIEPKK